MLSAAGYTANAAAARGGELPVTGLGLGVLWALGLGLMITGLALPSGARAAKGCSRDSVT